MSSDGMTDKSSLSSDDYRELYIEASTQVAMSDAKVADIEKQLEEVLAVDEELRTKDKQNETDLDKMRGILAGILQHLDECVEAKIDNIEAVRMSCNTLVYNRVV